MECSPVYCSKGLWTCNTERAGQNATLSWRSLQIKQGRYVSLHSMRVSSYLRITIRSSVKYITRTDGNLNLNLKNFLKPLFSSYNYYVVQYSRTSELRIGSLPSLRTIQYGTWKSVPYCSIVCSFRESFVEATVHTHTHRTHMRLNLIQEMMITASPERNPTTAEPVMITSVTMTSAGENSSQVWQLGTQAPSNSSSRKKSSRHSRGSEMLPFSGTCNIVNTYVLQWYLRNWTIGHVHLTTEIGREIVAT